MASTEKIDWAQGIKIGGIHRVLASANVIITAPVDGPIDHATGKRERREAYVVQLTSRYARELAAAIVKAADACDGKPEGFAA